MSSGERVTFTSDAGQILENARRDACDSSWGSRFSACAVRNLRY
jgi:hypothetical protein